MVFQVCGQVEGIAARCQHGAETQCKPCLHGQRVDTDSVKSIAATSGTPARQLP